MMAKCMAMLVQRKGYKKVWIIAPDYAFGHQWVEDGRRFLKELIPDVQFIGESFTPLGEKDFGPYIADISREKPDVGVIRGPLSNKQIPSVCSRKCNTLVTSGLKV